MFDVGASLAAARETRGYSLADAERLTHIRQKYLSALERADWETLPGRTYARAFLRTYANALGLDADRFVLAFEELVPEPEEEPIAITPPPRRGRIGLGAVLVLAGAGALAGIVWLGSSGGPHAQPPAAAPGTGRQAIGVLGVRHTTKPKATAKAVVHRTTIRRVTHALVVRATRGDCWLQVRQGGATGSVVYEGLLQQGGTLRFNEPNLWLRLGAPGMVDVARGGKSLGGLAGVTPVNVTA